MRPRPQRWTTALSGCALLVPTGAVLPTAAAAQPAAAHRSMERPGPRDAPPARGRTTPADQAVVRRGAHCLVLGRRSQDALLGMLSTECESAVPRVAAAWGSAGRGLAVVQVPANRAEWQRLAPGAGDLGQLPAVTADTAVPGAAPRVAVLINPAVFSRLSAVGGRVVLSHELTHLATWAATGPQLPAWLVEGFADEVGYSGERVPLEMATSELRTDVHAGRLPVRLPADRDFEGAAYGGPQAYEGSWLAVRLLVDRYGQPAVARLYRQVGREQAPGALQRALVRLGTDLPSLTAAWRVDLQNRLG